MAVKYRGRTQKMWMQTPTRMNDCLSNLEAISLYSLPYNILISSFLTCNEWFKFHEIVGRIKGEEVHEVETPPAWPASFSFPSPFAWEWASWWIIGCWYIFVFPVPGTRVLRKYVIEGRGSELISKRYCIVMLAVSILNPRITAVLSQWAEAVLM